MEVDHSQKNANANCFDTEYWGTASLICQRSSGSQPRTCLPWDPVGLSIPKDFNSNLSFRNGAVADSQGFPKEVVHDRNQLIDSPIKSWLFSTQCNMVFTLFWVDSGKERCHRSFLLRLVQLRTIYPALFSNGRLNKSRQDQQAPGK